VRIRFVCRPVLLSKFWNFGANIMGIGILDFVSRNVDNLLVGSLLGVSALGHYNMAYQLMRMPELVVAGPVCMSLFPLLSRLSGDITTFRKDALFYMGLIVAVIMPVFAGLAVVSDLAIDVVLGEKWRATVPVLVLLGPAGVGVCIYSLFGTVLYAKGKPHLQLRLSLLIACGIAVGVLVGSTNGISGVAGGVSVAMLIAAPFYLVVVGRELQCSPFTILARFSPSAIATLMMVAAALIARAALPATAEPVLLVTVAAMGALVYLGAFCLLGGDQTRQAYILLTTSQKLKALKSSAGL
jgi:PST family polysaccharide transporter